MIISLIKNALELYYNSKLTKEKLDAKKLKKFRKLIKYIEKKSPYYSKIIKDNKIDVKICTPSDFPILTKEEYIKNFDIIVTGKKITKEHVSSFLENSLHPGDLFQNKYIVIHTSGTSGKIAYFLFKENEWLKGFIQSIRLHKLGFRKKFAYVAATKGHFAGVTLVYYGKRFINKIFYNIITIDINKPFEEIISELNSFNPKVISGYAKAIKLLANAKNKGELCINPEVIECGGEPLFSKDQDYIQKAFKVPVINVYASSEHLIMGIGKDNYDGMYLMEDELIYECKKDGICVTNLFNYTCPLIRYEMKDILIPKFDDKKIFNFTKINNLVGRDEYSPVFENNNGKEDFIHPIIFVEFFVNNLKGFQIRLDSKKRFTFFALYSKDISNKEKILVKKEIDKKLKNILKEKLMDKVKYNIQEVNELKIDKKTGKFRLIIKNQ
ncbi:hypothetical protein COU57_03710 [Candidatus Pacearchaeota archaeon CG10_big_fil_rev_8_21_14_0_10_32_14]|nr:MAG: hypothetical protein COU57_03710 [Candidatus Pacearchaeota archaeon CG10_big_fil_rev_8_21_14_0_10_32_14]